jgi:hypothetical protein
MTDRYMTIFCVLMVGFSLLTGVSSVMATSSNSPDITIKIGESLMFDGNTGCTLQSYNPNYFTKTGNKKTGIFLKAKKTGTTTIRIYIQEIDTTITSTIKIKKK